MWFEKAIVLDPHKSHLYFNKGLALEYLKRYEEAIECFDLSIKYDPNNIENYYEKVWLLSFEA
jgi:tetratricopeptide (TPR) repeat protein